MKNWIKIKFGDLYKVPSRNGINRPSAVRGAGYKMINMGEIFGHDRLWDIDMERVLLNQKEQIIYSIEGDDLIFARQSIVAEGAGKCSIVKEVKELTCFESHIIRVRLNELIAYPEYYYYLFQSELGKAFLSSIRQQGVQAGIRGSDLEKLMIPFPPLPVQKCISKILSAYDDLIENNLKRIKLLEEIAQRTYEEWFVKFRINGEQLSIDESNGLPVGWDRKLLKEIAKVNEQSINRKFDGKIKYVDISSVSTGKIDSFTEYSLRDAPGRARRVVRHGDIIWSCVRPNRKSYSIIWHPEENLIVSTGFAVLSPVKLPTSYLYCFITTEAYVGYLISRTGGAAYPAVTSEVFEESIIVIPEQNLVRIFDEMIKPTIELITKLTYQNHFLKEARDILLPRLMSGEIDVEEMELAGVATK